MNHRTKRSLSNAPTSAMDWRDADALAALGGQATLGQIYSKIEQRGIMDFAANPNWEAAVRRTIQQHSSDTEIFAGLPEDEIFTAPLGKGGGIWALREYVPTPAPLGDLITVEPAPVPAGGQSVPFVFVSHSHQDNAFTHRLVSDLRAAGADVWVDVTEVEHDNYIRQINEGLKSRHWLVLVMTPASKSSPWVQLEVDAAIALAVQKRMRGIIPVVAEPVDAGEVPPTWAAFHRYDATKVYGAAFAPLLRVVGL